MIDAVVIKGKKVDIDRARRIADKFEVELTDELPNSKDASFFLIDKTGLSFITAGQELKGDFSRLLSRVTGGHLQHEILLKAADKLGDMKAVDATAGMGEDSFILAAGGYEVELFEHNPITAEVLRDALLRARNTPELRDIAKRMKLTEGDSKKLLKDLNYYPDIIYLDPMFPEKKKSAETKKKLQLLHQIELPCEDEEELVKAAMDAKPKRIIVKRPPEGDNLAGIKPTFSITRKAVRFDCIEV